MTKTISTFLLFLLCVIQISNAQDSIPNADFEHWNSNTSPMNWQSVNMLLPPGYITCHQTSNSYNGDHALQLKTIDMDGFPIPGVVTLGTIGMGYSAGGTGFSTQPISLKGFIQHPSYDDEVMVVVEFFKNGTEIGSGFWSTTDSIPNYTEFIAPIYFQSTENPDTMNITILTDQNTIGSSLLVDALQFELTTTRVSNVKNEKVNVYPNPCRNYISLDIPGDRPSEIMIYDMQGALVMHHSIAQNYLDTSALNQGIYTLVIKSNDSIYKEKLIKQ